MLGQFALNGGQDDSKDTHVVPLLINLPVEIVAFITRELDRSTAHSLSLVCRNLAAPASDALWRHLDLTFPYDRATSEPEFTSREAYLHKLWFSYGSRPSSPDHGAGEPENDFAAAEVQKRGAQRQRIMAVLEQGEARDWEGVESMRIVSRPGSASETALLLELTSNRLRSLEIMGCDDSLNLADEFSASHSLDLNLLHRVADLRRCGLELQFPLLHTLVLHNSALRWTETILLFCEAAPSLTSLDCALNDSVCFHRDLHQEPEYFLPGALSGPTRLQRLRIRYTPMRERELTPEEDRREGSGYDIAVFLKQSPDLVRLSLDYDCVAHDSYSAIGTAACRLPSLMDFHMGTISGAGLESINVGNLNVSKPYGALRRVILGYDAWKLPDQALMKESVRDDEPITLPLLEVLGLDCSKRLEENYDPVHFYSATSKAQALEAGTSAWIRNSPRLRFLHFFNKTDDDDVFSILDQAERGGSMTGEVRSIVHADKELIHVRLLMQDVTLAAKPCQFAELSRAAGSGRIIYAAGKNAEFDGLVTKRSEPVFRDWTDLDGDIVPMTVLGKIKEVEGDGVNWEARRVQVGAAAWQVVEDSRAGARKTRAGKARAANSRSAKPQD